MAWHLVNPGSGGRNSVYSGKSRRKSLMHLVEYGNEDSFIIHSRTGERIASADAFDELFPKRIARPIHPLLSTLAWLCTIAITSAALVATYFAFGLLP